MKSLFVLLKARKQSPQNRLARSLIQSDLLAKLSKVQTSLTSSPEALRWTFCFQEASENLATKMRKCGKHTAKLTYFGWPLLMKA